MRLVRSLLVWWLQVWYLLVWCLLVWCWWLLVWCMLVWYWWLQVWSQVVQKRPKNLLIMVIYLSCTKQAFPILRSAYAIVCALRPVLYSQCRAQLSCGVVVLEVPQLLMKKTSHNILSFSRCHVYAEVIQAKMIALLIFLNTLKQRETKAKTINIRRQTNNKVLKTDNAMMRYKVNDSQTNIIIC